jgi:hypothetical protein
MTGAPVTEALFSKRSGKNGNLSERFGKVEKLLSCDMIFGQ